jgi:hypothetical protein
MEFPRRPWSAPRLACILRCALQIVADLCCVVPAVCVQAAKAAAAAAAPAKPTKEDGPALEDDSDEITDPTAYFENRVKCINGKKAKGQNPYPHKFPVTMSLPEFIEKFGSLETGQQLTDTTVAVAGVSRCPLCALHFLYWSGAASAGVRRACWTALPRRHRRPYLQQASLRLEAAVL